MRLFLLLVLFSLVVYRNDLQNQEQFDKIWVRFNVQKQRADYLERAIKKVCPDCETRP